MSREVEILTFDDFAKRYCEKQLSTPDELKETLNQQLLRFSNTGWMLLECQDMCSSRMGSLTILPYGPDNSYKTPPFSPISPRGLASDMSVVVAILPVENFPKK